MEHGAHKTTEMNVETAQQQEQQQQLLQKKKRSGLFTIRLTR